MKLSCRNSVLIGCLFLVAVFWSPRNATAQDIVEDQQLSFGEIVVISTLVVGRVTVNPSGGYSFNSNIYLHSPPQRGEYRVTGGPPLTAYTVIVPATFVITGPGGPFSVDNVLVSPGALVTDAAGEGSFTISARLQTLGGGTYYGDGTYTENFPVTINF